MKTIFIAAMFSIVLMGCSPSNNIEISKGQVKVEYVTVTDLKPGSSNNQELVVSLVGQTKTFSSSPRVAVYIEKNHEHLTITQIERLDNGKKRKSVDLYNPDALVSYSTGDYIFTDRTSGLYLP